GVVFFSAGYYSAGIKFAPIYIWVVPEFYALVFVDCKSKFLSNSAVFTYKAYGGHNFFKVNNTGVESVLYRVIYRVDVVNCYAYVFLWKFYDIVAVLFFILIILSIKFSVFRDEYGVWLGRKPDFCPEKLAILLFKWY